MNWGWKITIVYMGFAAMILTLVYKSTQENYELVTTDYYKKEQLHQGKIDAARRAKSENQTVQCLVNKNGVQIIFPSEAQKSKKDIEIYCPTDQSKDQVHTIEQNAIALSLAPAKYLIKMSWKVHQLSYHQEKSIWIK
jgi:hypothetical protein